MILYPAVDIRGGGAVRLSQGDFGREANYGDPLDLARSYADAGAQWIHVVDLDAARTGTATNRALVLDICKLIDVQVQVGGGVRSRDDAAMLLDGGAARVVIGTKAIIDPDLVISLAESYPGQIAVGLDYRLGGAEVAISGWESDGGISVGDALQRLGDAPIAAVVATAIDRDGMLTGPDLEGSRALLGSTSIPVIASGGVSGAADLRALSALSNEGRSLVGAIVGKAIVEGHLSVEEGIMACAASV